MSDPDLSNSIGPWFQFSDELRINALHLLNQPTLELGVAGLAQPKVLAAALLARTITNHKAVLMLLRAGLITEARTLTRSCLENVLWMRRIKAEGMEFVTAILDDARQANISFAKTLLPSADFLSKEDKGHLQRHAMIKAPKKISPSEKTDTDEAQAEYLLFKGLSGDSAHPSARALSRHLPTNVDGWIDEFFIEPPMSRQDLGFTLHFATSALLNAMSLDVDVQPNEQNEAILRDVGTEYNRLADQTLLVDV
jgi:hypothetical protein